jgi:peroxiredoxin
MNARTPLAPGGAFPDLELPDHSGNTRRLSELVAGDPTVLHCYRGWWCPKRPVIERYGSAQPWPADRFG